jgi:hypothetical protein
LQKSALYTFFIYGHLQSAHGKFAAADAVTKDHFELRKTEQEAHMTPRRRRTARAYRPGGRACGIGENGDARGKTKSGVVAAALASSALRKTKQKK